MMEIKNRTSGPVQLLVKSFSPRREHSNAFTVQNIPGHKTIRLADERIVDEYLQRNKAWGLISYKYIPDIEAHKEEK